MFFFLFFHISLDLNCSCVSLGNTLATGKEKTESILSLWISTDCPDGYWGDPCILPNFLPLTHLVHMLLTLIILFRYINLCLLQMLHACQQCSYAYNEMKETLLVYNYMNKPKKKCTDFTCLVNGVSKRYYRLLVIKKVIMGVVIKTKLHTYLCNP